jgi:formate hydrogenlyase subunit 6/NADH:ubiquinone oxidoreductase subunit I
MIINLQHYKKNGYVKGIILIVRKMFLSLNQPVFKEEVTSWSGENVYHKYPKLEIDQETQKSKCTSCHICEDVCPNKCIVVEGVANNNSIREGKDPKSFWLNLSTCLQCNECVDICPVDALSSNGSYSQSYFENETSIDLKLIESNN